MERINDLESTTEEFNDIQFEIVDDEMLIISRPTVQLYEQS